MTDAEIKRLRQRAEKHSTLSSEERDVVNRADMLDVVEKLVYAMGGLAPAAFADLPLWEKGFELMMHGQPHESQCIGATLILRSLTPELMAALVQNMLRIMTIVPGAPATVVNELLETQSH